MPTDPPTHPPAAEPPRTGPPQRASSVPFVAGSRGYRSFRIPACVRAPDGALLAFAEGRVHSSDDTGDIDIVQRRSTDGGLSWGEQTVAAEYGPGTAGNPAPVVLPGSGAGARVLLVYVTNAAYADERSIRRGEVPAADGRRVWLRESRDGARTWSVPREITATVKRPEWRWYAVTPGHALRLARGRYAGRLVVPANHSVPPWGGGDGSEGRYDGGHDLLSDDGGATWRIGYVDGTPGTPGGSGTPEAARGAGGAVDVNETTAAELPDGRLYFNTRTDSPAPWHRADAYSADGGATLLRPFRPQPALTTPVVEGSLLQLNAPELLLFSAPADPERRRRMTVWAGEGGGTWRRAHTLDDRPAAYSDLVRVDRDTVGLLYETGETGAYEAIEFRRIPVAELLGRRDR